MKRILWLTVIVAAVWGLPRLSHPAVDIGKLEPVETVLLTAQESEISLETDSGARGSGKTLEEAISDLRDSSGTEVYLDTTSKLLIAGDAKAYWPEILETFRPSCRVCRVDGEIDLKEATEYLSVHKPEMTLNQLRAGQTDWQILMVEEGRGRLVPK